MSAPLRPRPPRQVLLEDLPWGNPRRVDAVLSVLTAEGWQFTRQMTEADEHYQFGDECDHDGEPWPCSFERANPRTSEDSAT